MNYKSITVAGSGVLGSQIAFQTAYKGFHVNVYDISDQVLGQAKERLTKFKTTTKKTYAQRSRLWMRLFSRISFYADLAQAVADADLVIEAIPEVAKIKTDFYTQLGRSLRTWQISSRQNTWKRASFAEPRGEAFTRILIPVLQARTSYELDGYAINGSQKRLVTVGECALLRFSQ